VVVFEQKTKSMWNWKIHWGSFWWSRMTRPGRSESARKWRAKSPWSDHYFCYPPITYYWTVPLISRWELDKFKNCWNKSFRISRILTLLYQQFSNLSFSPRDMSGPRLGALSNNKWSGGICCEQQNVVRDCTRKFPRSWKISGLIKSKAWREHDHQWAVVSSAGHLVSIDRPGYLMSPAFSNRISKKGQKKNRSRKNLSRWTWRGFIDESSQHRDKPNSSLHVIDAPRGKPRKTVPGERYLLIDSRHCIWSMLDSLWTWLTTIWLTPSDPSTSWKRRFTLLSKYRTRIYIHIVLIYLFFISAHVKYFIFMNTASHGERSKSSFEGWVAMSVHWRV
jgi:hypothetical protein